MTQLLTDDEILSINQDNEVTSYRAYARAIEAAVLDRLSNQTPVCYGWFVDGEFKAYVFSELTPKDSNAIKQPLFAAPVPPDQEVIRDAERYRWLRDEHYLVNPVAAVVWKRNDDRNECEWVNTVDGYSLDCHIDQAMKEQA